MCGVTFVPGETAGSSVFPLSAMLILISRLILNNPLRQPNNFILLFGQHMFILYATYFNKVSASVVEAVVIELSKG